VPVVVLSRRNDEENKVRALDLGAADFVTKPFGMRELEARIRTALRHALPAMTDKAIFRTGDLSVDLTCRIVRVRGNAVRLSPKEYALLRLLVEHAGKVLTHGFLIGELWDEPVDTQYLRVYVRQLRRKIEADCAEPRYILTAPGIGYRLRTSDTGTRPF
jgi:two-component system KDP operon response regulator KdpE